LIISVTLFYLLAGIYSLLLLFLKKWRFPKFTVKMSFLTITVFIFQIFLIFSLFKILILLILALEILHQFIIIFLSKVLEVPIYFLKRRIEKKAADKISKINNLIAIGITGSYGKTSTKEFLFEILSRKFNCLKTEGNINVDFGIAKFVLKNLSENHNIFICEMGAYRKGEVKKICQIVKPKIGIITGVNEQHLGLFGSMENLISAEGGRELVESLPQNGLVIFNGDNKYCREIYRQTQLPKKLCTLNKSSVETLLRPDIWAENIRVEKEFIYFQARTKDGEFSHFRINVLGQHNILNILMAIMTAKEMRMSLEEISLACLKIKPEQSGMKFLKKDGPIIIDSSYSANPDGVIADLEYLKIYSGKKIVIMPCLIELGSASSEIHRRIAKKIAEVCDLAIITSRDYFPEIKKAALSQGMKKNSILFSVNPAKILKILKPYHRQENVILLEGRVPKKLVQELSV
ncbi:MAG: hypothetical protein FJZ07_01990, partial [Candidatus Nealsonbacteria bacterium]|nr:hypothetical protein [Candidatus Nealsonbacteria bacterium]